MNDDLVYEIPTVVLDALKEFQDVIPPGNLSHFHRGELSITKLSWFRSRSLLPEPPIGCPHLNWTSYRGNLQVFFITALFSHRRLSLVPRCCSREARWLPTATCRLSGIELGDSEEQVTYISFRICSTVCLKPLTFLSYVCGLDTNKYALWKVMSRRLHVWLAVALLNSL